jgi:23S rRNA (guanine745-N1)-methyltransferase
LWSGAVLPLAHKPAFGILRCPVCRCDLNPVGRSLVCQHRHNFDVARSGYVNLTAGRGSRVAAAGDRGAQLQRRSAFLASGHFDFIADAIVRRARPVRARSSSRLRILDAGCGTGYHLGRIARHRLETDAPAHGLGLDISKQAARMGALHFKELAFAVTDLWADWPIRSDSVDLVINVFAPKNFRESARVLAPDGLLAVAYPGEEHLVELRHEFDLMGMKEGKARNYLEAMQPSFGEVRVERFRQQSELDPEDVINAIGMGPNAMRMLKKPVVPAGPRTVTFDVEILFARRPPTPG